MSTEGFIKFLEGYGVRNISLNGNELKISCPFPGHATGDSHPSASINIEKKVFNCLSLHGGLTLEKFLEKLTGKKSAPKKPKTEAGKHADILRKRQSREKNKIEDTSRLVEKKIGERIHSILYPYKQSVDYHLAPIVDYLWSEKDLMDKKLKDSTNSSAAFAKYSDWLLQSQELLDSTDKYIQKLGLKGEPK